ncbi:MAG: hypothetical protein ACI95C_000348 [Pseudohongiellaceae bacterium]
MAVEKCIHNGADGYVTSSIGTDELIFGIETIMAGNRFTESAKTNELAINKAKVKRNIDFVRAYLLAEKLKIVAEDVTQRFSRKVNYYPATGKVRVKKLRSLSNEDIAQREKQFIKGVQLEPVGGDAELF